MSSIHHMVELSIYVDNLETAVVFYRDVLCLESLGIEPERHAFFKVGRGILLVFVPSEAQKGFEPGALPQTGQGKIVFGIPEGSIPEWRSRLERVGIVIEEQSQSSKGSTSIAFRDPSGNCVRLITPGLWGLGSTV